MYTPLFIKTDNSLLSSLIKVDDLILNLKKKNLTSCGVADDNLYGTMEIVSKFKKNGIKPVIGLDLKELVLYVKNKDGYYNLVRIETFKNKNELSFDVLKQFSDGLICVCFNLDNYNKYKDIYNDIYIGVTNKSEEELYGDYDTVFFNKTLYLEIVTLYIYD